MKEHLESVESKASKVILDEGKRFLKTIPLGIPQPSFALKKDKLRLHWKKEGVSVIVYKDKLTYEIAKSEQKIKGILYGFEQFPETLRLSLIQTKE